MATRNLKWTILKTIQLADCRVFTVHKNIASAPGSAETHDFYVIRPRNWVNVIPITAEGEVVLVEQYRHGIDEVVLEIPGGMIDPEDVSSLSAATRELVEETGYVAEEMIFIGRTQPNPAIQDNYCDTYLAVNAKYVQAPQFDGNEDIELKLVQRESIPELIYTGAISHALVIVAFHYLSLYEARINKPDKESLFA
jgi:8-oxo-dGTP pyrophosphatase MutT (NUDIX family)